MTTATPMRAQQRPATKEEIERMKREKDEQAAKEVLRPKEDKERVRPKNPKPTDPGGTG